MEEKFISTNIFIIKLILNKLYFLKKDIIIVIIVKKITLYTAHIVSFQVNSQYQELSETLMLKL